MYTEEEKLKYLNEMRWINKYDRDKPGIAHIPEDLMLRDRDFLIRAIKQPHTQLACVSRYLIHHKSDLIFNPEILAYIMVYEKYHHNDLKTYLDNIPRDSREHYLYMMLVKTTMDTPAYKIYYEEISTQAVKHDGRIVGGGKTNSDTYLLSDDV